MVPTGPAPTLAEGVIPSAFEATESPSLRPLFPSPLPLGDPSDLAHYDNGTFAGPVTDELLLATPFAESIGSLGRVDRGAFDDDQPVGLGSPSR